MFCFHFCTEKPIFTFHEMLITEAYQFCLYFVEQSFDQLQDMFPHALKFLSDTILDVPGKVEADELRIHCSINLSTF